MGIVPVGVFAGVFVIVGVFVTVGLFVIVGVFVTVLVNVGDGVTGVLATNHGWNFCIGVGVAVPTMKEVAVGIGVPGGARE